MSQSRAHNLKNLIAPLISIDLYEPKIHDDSIVVVFEVFQNYDAAYDLSSFIEKLPELTLDTEARETPNESGNYEVFCEFERNADFPDVFMSVLKDVEKIGNKQQWNIDAYGKDQVLPLTNQDTIRQNIRLVNNNELKEFLDYSGVTATFQKDHLLLENKTMKQSINVEHECYFVSEDQVKLMIQKYGITEAHNARIAMFPYHEVCNFVGTDLYLLEHNGQYLILT